MADQNQIVPGVRVQPGQDDQPEAPQGEGDLVVIQMPREILDSLTAILEAAKQKADQDIAAQTGGAKPQGPDMGGLENFGAELDSRIK